MEEVFKPIVGFPGYEISNRGNVKLKTGRISSGWDPGLGYRKIRLYYDGGANYESFYIHQLVAKHFIHNPFNKPCVNHIDCNPSNNAVANLEWCTQKENMIHAARHNRMRGSPKPVIDKVTGQIFKSVKEAAESIGVKPNTLVYQLLGKRINNTGLQYLKHMKINGR